MKYVLMMISREDFWDELTAEEQAAVVKQHETFTNNLKAQGKFVDSCGLAPVSKAKTLRRTGRTENHVTDGPYAESKEVMGGYYTILADSMEEALDWARQLPFVTTGAVEVRPAMGGD